METLDNSEWKEETKFVQMREQRVLKWVLENV